MIMTDGEQVGIPLAALMRCFGRRSARHMMITHVLSVPKKLFVMRLLRLAPLIDCFIVYCSAQRDHLMRDLGVPSGRILLSTFMVDSQFFSRQHVSERPARMICAAGLERRDYRTLLQAVQGLDVRVVIAAASPWSKWPDSSRSTTLPDNVEIRKFDHFELRQLYADAALVVVPLDDVDFQAGITTILEAMAMGKAVICTRTRGQSDTIIDGETGLYVPPGDVVELRSAITRLISSSALTRHLGEAARDWVLKYASLDIYVERLSARADELTGSNIVNAPRSRSHG
jgi:glycosyltransferase involved in cell wall biosynthesis